MRRFGYFAALVGCLAGGVGWTSRPAVARAGTCAVHDDDLDFLAEQIQSLITNPAKQGVRDSLSLPATLPESVVVIEADSLCDLAGRAINRDLQLDESTRRVISLIKIGSSRYWAEDFKIGYGEWIRSFVLDSTLANVVSRTQH